MPASRTLALLAAAAAVACMHVSRVHAATLPNSTVQAITDPNILLKYADDFGYVVHEFPSVAFCPSSSAELVATVRWAYQNRVPTSTRAQGHSASGQTQSKVAVIDTSCMNRVLEVNLEQRYIEVQAGATWNTVFEALAPVGHRVLGDTDAKILSVGGTLSIGGASVFTSTYGFAGHHVISLKLVTGTGSLVDCSPTRRPNLFNHVLGGQGQLGVISSVRLRIEPINIPAFRWTMLLYNDFAECWRDLHNFVLPGEVRTHLGLDGAYAVVVPNTVDGLAPYASVFAQLRAAVGDAFVNNFLAQSSTLCIMDAIDLDGSSNGKLFPSASRLVVPVSHPEIPAWFLFNLRLNEGYAQATQSPFFANPRFSYLSFSPTQGADDVALRQLAHDMFVPLLQVPGAAIGFCVYDKAGIKDGPIIALPRNTDILMITAIVSTFSVPGSQRSADVTHVTTRQTFSAIWGGLTQLRPESKLYPFTVVDGYDWRTHYGSNYDTLRALKRTHDPRNILGRGAAIFFERPTKRDIDL